MTTNTPSTARESRTPSPTPWYEAHWWEIPPSVYARIVAAIDRLPIPAVSVLPAFPTLPALSVPECLCIARDNEPQLNEVLMAGRTDDLTARLRTYLPNQERGCSGFVAAMVNGFIGFLTAAFFALLIWLCAGGWVVPVMWVMERMVR